MKWTAISGSWKKVDEQVKEDVEKAVRNVLRREGGIITGGALGVDYIATQTVLEEGDVPIQIKIYLPIKLEALCEHYWKRAGEGVITGIQAGEITSQLKKIYELAPKAVFDNTPYAKADIESYYARNTDIIKGCDILYAFQVNDSKGTEDAIEKARKFGKEVIVKKYFI